MYEVRITAPAEADIQTDFLWWKANRSVDQAIRWYEAIYPAIDTLAHFPERCPRAAEDEFYPGKLRQLLFTIGRRPTHRIVFAVDDRVV